MANNSTPTQVRSTSQSLAELALSYNGGDRAAATRCADIAALSQLLANDVGGQPNILAYL